MTKILVPSKWGIDTNTSGSNPTSVESGRAAVNCKMREKIQALGISLEVRDGNRVPDDQDEYTIRGVFDWRGKEYDLVRTIIPNINVPRTCTLDEFLAHPFYPVVVKNELTDNGQGKFLVETPEQWDKFNKFLLNEKKYSRDSYHYQEFIETPGDRYTSYRALVSAKGTILAASLIYSETRKSSPTYLEDDIPLERLEVPGTSLDRYLTISGSPYFLRSKRITSNVATGGGIIPLNPGLNSKPSSASEKEILFQHGLDPLHPQLPVHIREYAQKIGSTLGRKLGLYTGIDFIQDRNGKIYYLEINRDPSLGTYMASHNRGEGTLVDAYQMIMSRAIDELTQ